MQAQVQGLEKSFLVCNKTLLVLGTRRPVPKAPINVLAALTAQGVPQSCLEAKVGVVFDMGVIQAFVFRLESEAKADRETQTLHN